MHDLGKANEVQLLVSSVNLNAVDENGNSALMVAAERGKNKLVVKLFKH